MMALQASQMVATDTSSRSETYQNQELEAHSRESEMSNWYRLPNEIILGILSKLHRCDVDRCREVNRHINQIVEKYEKELKKRIIQKIEISNETRAFQVTTQCREQRIKKRVKKFYDYKVDRKLGNVHEDSRVIKKKRRKQRASRSIPEEAVDLLRRIVRHGELQCLELYEMYLNPSILSTLSSILHEAECRVDSISIDFCSLKYVTADQLRAFIVGLEPRKVQFFTIRHATKAHFDSQMMHFLCSRDFYLVKYITGLDGKSVQIELDDQMLLATTARSYTVHNDHLIAFEGVRELIKSLLSRSRFIDNISIKFDMVTFLGIYRWLHRIMKSHLPDPESYPRTFNLLRNYLVTFQVTETEHILNIDKMK